MRPETQSEDVDLTRPAALLDEDLQKDAPMIAGASYFGERSPEEMRLAVLDLVIKNQGELTYPDDGLRNDDAVLKIAAKFYGFVKDGTVPVPEKEPATDANG